MNKYVSLSMVNEQMMEADVATLIANKVIAINGKNQVLFNGKLVPSGKLEGFVEHLMSEFLGIVQLTIVPTEPAPTPAPEPAPTVVTTPAEWNNMYINLPSVGGKSFKKLSCRVWCELMMKEGVAPKQALWIVHHVFVHACAKENKVSCIKALTGKTSTFSTTWKTRITKYINSL